MGYDLNKEIKEAINAGENALRSLKEAQKYLNSAGNWGLVDIFGGGFFTDMIKHSKINNARQCMEAARQDLRSFQRELNDIDEYIPNIDVGDFLTFADFFFDGFLADVFVQSKISDAKRNVEDAIFRVQNLVSRLRQELR
ncbi:MAG TPA: hypothetical protein IAC41_08035 [Candidatus Merdenecus merdavium]|nr:hypothetical protein [Candidatus Merdenecus merdavium]